MAAGSLQALLAGPGWLDVLLHHILTTLSLQEMVKLGASCRRLRLLVANAPEAIWQVSNTVSVCCSCRALAGSADELTALWSYANANNLVVSNKDLRNQV